MNVGELREWKVDSGRFGTFIVIGLEGYRVDVILLNGRKDGFLKSYLVSRSIVISEAHERAA
jgi:hypothetical protein